MIIHINGKAGVGKLTVAEILAIRLDAVVIDNHIIIDFVTKFWERRTPGYFSMIEKLMNLSLEALSEQPTEKFSIFTNWLSADNEHDRAHLDQIAEFARNKNVPFVQILLDCGLIENQRRVVSDGRSTKGKLMDAAILRDAFKDELYHPASEHMLELDTTNRSAEAVADEITTFIAGIKR
jgi:cytidylate kinase